MCWSVIKVADCTALSLGGAAMWEVALGQRGMSHFTLCMDSPGMLLHILHACRTSQAAVHD